MGLKIKNGKKPDWMKQEIWDQVKSQLEPDPALEIEVEPTKPFEPSVPDGEVSKSNKTLDRIPDWLLFVMWIIVIAVFLLFILKLLIFVIVAILACCLKILVPKV